MGSPLLGRFKSRQFLDVIALITQECRSADSNQFTFVEASCSESTLHHIFRFRTKDKEVKKTCTHIVCFEINRPN